MIHNITASDQRFFDLYPPCRNHNKKFEKVYEVASRVFSYIGRIFIALPALPAIVFTIILISAAAAGTALTVATIAVPCILLGVMVLGGVACGVARFLNHKELQAARIAWGNERGVIQLRTFLVKGCNLYGVEPWTPYEGSLKSLEKMGMISKETRKTLKPFYKLWVRLLNNRNPEDNEEVERLRSRWDEVKQQVWDDLPSEAIIKEAFF